MTEIVKCLEAWVESNRETPQLALRTLDGYLQCLSLLTRTGIEHVEQINRDSIGKWLEARRRAGVGTSTLNRNLAAVLSFCSMLEKQGKFELGSLEQLRRLRYREPPAPPPFFLTRDQIAQLLEVAPRVHDSFDLGVRIAVYGGLRLSEITRLHHEDVRDLHTEEPYLVVARGDGRETKTRRERSVPIATGLAAEFKRREIGPPQKGPLFPSQHALSSTPYLVKTTFERWMDVARVAGKLDKRCTFLALRHTFASLLLETRAMSVEQAAKIMGHGVKVHMDRYAGRQGGDKRINQGFAALERMIQPPPPAARAE